MAYIRSSEWETRLEEARRRREQVLAAKFAESNLPTEPSRHQADRTFAKTDAIAPTTHEPLAALRTSSDLKDPVLPTPESRLGRIVLFGAGLATVGTGAAVSLALVLTTSPNIDAGSGSDQTVASQETAAVPAPIGQDRGIVSDPIIPLSYSGTKDIASAARRDTVGELAMAVKDFLPQGHRITLTTSKDRITDLEKLIPIEDDKIDFRTTSFAPITSVVSYFHDDDEATARKFAELIAAEPMDLRGLIPSPPPGTMEVLLGGD